MENIIFQTSDGKEFEVSKSILNMLKNVANSWHGNFNIIIDVKDNFVCLSNVKSNDFSQILQYCHFHNFIEPPEIVRPMKFNDLKLCVSDQWDAEFINQFDFETVTELLMACDSLQCNSLADLCYAKLGLFFRSNSIPYNSYSY
jgi:hypothetical protein